jgi:hypothetical protein
MTDESGRHSQVLTSAHVKELLALALEAERSAAAPAAGDRTASAQRVLTALGKRLGEACEGVLARASDPAVPLDELRQSKALAKRAGMRAESDVERDAAALLYHVSVAAAWHRHGQHISRESIERRVAVYRRLGRLFDGEPIGGIFQSISKEAFK